MKFLKYVRGCSGMSCPWRRGLLYVLAISFLGGALTLVLKDLEKPLLAYQKHAIEQRTPELLNAITVNDVTQVQVWMRALEQQPGIQRAELMSPDGASLALFARAGQATTPEQAFALASVDDVQGQMHTTIPLQFDGMRVAQLHVVLSVWPVFQRAMVWGGMVLLLCWGLYAAYTQSRFKIRWARLEPAQAEVETFNVQQALRLALEQADIRIKFEPRPELHDGGGVFGMQVWVCWPQPDGRVLQRSPADFVEEASQDGLFLPLADWVLETACQQAAQWQRAYGPLALTLNISKYQLQDPNFSTRVRAICEAAQFPYQSLVFEVNERVVEQDLAQSLANIQALIGQGLCLTVAEQPAVA